MQNLFNRRKALNLDPFIGKIADHTRATPFPLSVAPNAKRFRHIPLLFGQHIWAVPSSAEQLTKIARDAACNLLLVRDMKDRDLLRSVRCDLSFWSGEDVHTVQNLIPHVGLWTTPLLLTQDGSSMIHLTSRGLSDAFQLADLSSYECLEGIEMAARLLLGLKPIRFAV